MRKVAVRVENKYKTILQKAHKIHTCNKSVFTRKDFTSGILIITNHSEGPWHAIICSEDTNTDSVLGAGVGSESLG